MKTKMTLIIVLATLFGTTVWAKDLPGVSKMKEKQREELYIEDDNARAERLEELEARVYEINEMNIDEMTRTERKMYKEELQDIKKEMKVQGGGVYISVGAAIIIILLLIILL